jgi:hypothetical protein
MTEFLLADEVHSVGDPQCPMCLEEYPEVCECGGLIHSSGQSDGEDEIIVATRCDGCGRSEDDLESDVA